jgi:hypothetical protein
MSTARNLAPAGSDLRLDARFPVGKLRRTRTDPISREGSTRDQEAS